MNDRDDMNQRQRQPRRGNYRIDASGNPIEQLTQDSFVHNTYSKQGIEPNKTSGDDLAEILRPRNYRITDYDENKKNWKKRSQQPEYVSFYDENQKYNQSPIINRVDKNPSNQRITKTQVTNYHRILSKLNSTRIQKDIWTRNLPENPLQLLLVFSVLFSIYIFAGNSLLPNHWVNKISVSGNQYVDGQHIANSSRIHSLDLIQRVMEQKDEIERKIIDENPIIEDVTFIRKNWRELELNVTEYEIVALIKQEGKLLPVMSNGEILETPIRVMNGVPITDFFPTLINFKQKGKISELTNNALRNIDDELLGRINSVEHSKDPAKPNSVIVKMKDGNEVHAIINTFAQKMNYYQQMVDQLNGQKGIIDLEVGAFFTPFENANSDNSQSNLDNNHN